MEHCSALSLTLTKLSGLYESSELLFAGEKICYVELQNKKRQKQILNQWRIKRYMRLNISSI